MDITETDRVLAGMLVENTGRHFLDSGDAYGRAWEKNQGKDVEDFLAEPAVTLSASWDYVDVTLSVFHWLRNRLEYEPVFDKVFHRWVDVFDPESYWLASMESFAFDVCGSERPYVEGTYNSYNSENDLSQDIQFTLFTPTRGRWAGDVFVLLQIHGGCDIRGGYTVPRVFRVLDSDGGSSLLEFDYFTVGHRVERPNDTPLPGMPPDDETPHIWDHRGGDWTDYEGSYIRDPWQDAGVDAVYKDDATGDKFVRCPRCAEPTPLEAWEYPT